MHRMAVQLHRMAVQLQRMAVLLRRMAVDMGATTEFCPSGGWHQGILPFRWVEPRNSTLQTGGTTEFYPSDYGNPEEFYPPGKEFYPSGKEFYPSHPVIGPSTPSHACGFLRKEKQKDSNTLDRSERVGGYAARPPLALIYK